MAQRLLGLDVGGSSIKAALIDLEQQRAVTPLKHVPTPSPATPDAVIEALVQLDRELGAEGPVGLAFPAVVRHGVAMTAANVDQSWIGYPGGARLAERIGRQVVFLNDAAAAGIAEMAAGAGKGELGTVMVLTFGTGIGSALFVDGQVVPMELGHMEFHGREAELSASARVRTVEHLDWAQWCARVNEFLARLHRLFWPDVFVIGGAISEDFEQYGHLLTSRAQIRRAMLGDQAGAVGAAFAAARGQQH